MTIEDFKMKMTIFYSLETGKIKTVVSGLQTMDIFGDDKNDYNYDFIQIDRDEYILDNSEKFKVVNGNISLIEEYKVNLQKYL